MPDLNEIIEISLDKISIGKSQARQRKVSVDDDLLESIKKNGLLHPVIVYQKDGGYELLTGQRRLLAHKKLGLKTIKAIIHSTPKDEYEAKKLSLIENAARKDMVYQDYVDTIEMFFNKYRKTSAVAEELGLSKYTVRRYLNFARLPKTVQDAVTKKEITIDNAVKALDAMGGEETTVDAKEVLQLANEMKKLSPVQQTKVKQIKQNEPSKSVTQVISMAKQTPISHKIEIEFTEDQVPRIEKFKTDNKLDSTEEAAEELVDIGLEKSGY